MVFVNGPIDQLCQRADAEAYQRGYEQGKKDALLQKENLQVSTVIGYESGYEDGAKAEREKAREEFKWMKPVCFGRHEAICDTRCAWAVRERCIESLRATPSKQGRDPE